MQLSAALNVYNWNPDGDEEARKKASMKGSKLDRIAAYLNANQPSFLARVIQIIWSHPFELTSWILVLLLVLGSTWLFVIKPTAPPPPEPCSFRPDTAKADITVHFRTRYFGGCTFGPIHEQPGIIDWKNGNKGDDPGTGIYGQCGSTTILITRDTSVPADFSIWSISDTPTTLPARDKNPEEYRLLLSEEAAVRFTRMLQPEFRKQFDGWIGYNDAAEVFYSSTHAKVVSNFFSLKMIPFEEKEFGLYYAHSNCAGFNGRNKYVKLLRDAGLPLWAGGKCLNEDPSQLVERGGDSEVCRRFMFYSALENSNCEGYISEKLLNAVNCQAIPLIYSPRGYPDYLKRLPEGSFINVWDFETPEALVAELRSISQDKKRYNRFFKAKRFRQPKKKNLEKTILSSQGEGRWNQTIFCQLARLKRIGRRPYEETSLATHMGNCLDQRDTLLAYV